jgi:putative transcriptional regulator
MSKHSLQGKLLVASPHLGDGNFFRSVVLLVKHDDEGAFGVILNRPTNNTLGEIWKAVDAAAGEMGDIHPDLTLEGELVAGEKIHIGGPVQGPLVAIHTFKKYSEAQIITGVHFAAHKDHLKKIITQKKKPFRIFSGYSGWGGGQLEGELQAGGWLIAESAKELIFYAGEDLWERVVQNIGQQVLGPAVKTKHIPPDASLN